MKNCIKRLSLLLIIALFFGCSKDSPSSSSGCTPIPCLNGGVSRPDCGCNCPQGYTGSNCGIQITPTKILVSNIRVNYFPNSDSTGSFWDPSYPTTSLASPDIYVTLQDASSNVIYTAPNYYPNVLSNGSNYFDFTPTTPIQLPIASVYSYFQVNLWDYDSADSNINSSDDLMGKKSFYPYSSSGGFPSTITVSDDSYPVSFTLTLSYVW